MFFFLIEVELIYNVVLISDAQQSDSVIHTYILSLSFFFCLFFAFSRAAPEAYGGSQARGLRQRHSNTRSEPSLRPATQLTATLDP